jgi:hypothetical protein
VSAISSASADVEAAAGGGDWLDRLLERAPAPAWVVATGFGVVILAAAAVAALLLERPEDIVARGFLGNRDLRLGVTITALAAYAPAARYYHLRHAGRNRAALRSLLHPRNRAAVDTPIRWPPGWVAWVPVALGPLVGLAIDRDPGLYFRSGYWSVGSVWTWSVGLFMAWCLGRSIAVTIAVSRQFSKIAAGLTDVDLLDRRWLAPFVSLALFSSLLWLLVPALWAVNLVDAPFLYVVPVVTAVCVVFGTIALLLPTRGLRRRLQEAKERELALTHAALRGDDAALSDSVLAARLERPTVADLVAWARYVGELSTSPFTGASRLRFVLYLALPLGSWLGGALVEWLVERLLA